MHTVIRVDASTEIGTGHVIRCITLASVLKKNNHQITFLCRKLSGNLIQHIKSNGFNVITLNESESDSDNDDTVPHAKWLHHNWKDDAQECKRTLNELHKTDWLIIDHYALDKKWETALRSQTQYIMVIDDVADREHDTNILLDQNLYPDMSKRYTHLIADDCTTLLGQNYTLLRDEFIQFQNRITTRKKIQNILVFFGGVDEHNLTLRTINAIQTLRLDINVNIVIGSTNPHTKSIIAACEHDNNLQCHINTTHMAEMMLQADLAIGAGGTTTWERCYLGLPSIVLTLAINQLSVNQAVAEQGACILAGDYNISEEEISTHITALIDHSDILTNMSKSALALMKNHLGANSVVQTLESFHA